jgi:hypothetical protein
LLYRGYGLSLCLCLRFCLCLGLRAGREAADAVARPCSAARGPCPIWAQERRYRRPLGNVGALALASKVHPGGLLVLESGGQVAWWPAGRTAHDSSVRGPALSWTKSLDNGTTRLK